MHKVIVERPRTGGDGGKSDEPKGYKKKLERAMYNDGDLPVFESSARRRRYGWEAKEFSERLGPLRKYLHSKLGESWDEVWSEICANLRCDSTVQSHVRDHVGWDVEKQVHFVNGEPHNLMGKIYARFYVHPETGVLCENKRKKYNWNHQYPKKFVPGRTANHQYHIIDGVWYEVELAPFPKRVKTDYGWSHDTVHDVLLSRKKHFNNIWGGASRSDCQRQYGKEMYAVKKLQLNKKEIKKLKLWETDVGIRAKEKMAA
jgi:hypothetical protein